MFVMRCKNVFQNNMFSILYRIRHIEGTSALGDFFLKILLGILSFFTVVGGGLFVGILFGIATALLTRYLLISFSA